MCENEVRIGCQLLIKIREGRKIQALTRSALNISGEMSLHFGPQSEQAVPILLSPGMLYFDTPWGGGMNMKVSLP